MWSKNQSGKRSDGSNSHDNVVLTQSRPALPAANSTPAQVIDLPEPPSISTTNNCTPQNNESQPAPMRSKSGNRRIPPEVIEKICQFDSSVSIPEIRRRLVRMGVCTNDNAPSATTISNIKRRRSEDRPQRSTDGILPAATAGQKRSAPGGTCTPDNKSRKKHSKGTQEGLQGADKQQPMFAILTADQNERMTVNAFLDLGNTFGKVWDGARGCSWKTDSYLQETKTTVTSLPSNSLHYGKMFQLEVGNDRVTGVHLSCSDIGPHGATKIVNKLLADAKAQNWPLKVIFLVGCCGGSLTDSKKMEKNWHGTVLLAQYLKDYLNIGKIEAPAGQLSQCVPRVCDLRDKWLQPLQEVANPCRRQGFSDIPVLKTHVFLSGPLVIKEQLFSDHFRYGDIAGVEMEGAGVVLAMDLAEDWCPGEHLPDVVIVKGISDYTGNKGERSKAVFFDAETEAEVDDDARQQIATYHSIALVIRCMAANIQELVKE